MEVKTIITALIVIIAIGFAYVFFFNPSSPVSYEDGEKTNATAFASALQVSNNVFIVTDLRDSTSAQRSNIMQCGVDFAGSSGLAGKNITIYSIEGSQCISTEAKYSPKECIDKSKFGVTIFIKSGTNSVFYKNKLVVGVPEKYNPKECNIVMGTN